MQLRSYFALPVSLHYQLIKLLIGFEPPDVDSLEVETIPIAKPDPPMFRPNPFALIFISSDKPDPVPPFKLPLRIRSGIDITSKGTGTCV